MTLWDARFVLFDDDTRLMAGSSYEGTWDKYFEDHITSFGYDGPARRSSISSRRYCGTLRRSRAEEARYAQVLALVDAAQDDPELKAAIIDEAGKAEEELIAPLLQFRNFGLPLAYHWTTINNGAAFGTDYFTRTAVAKSNILVNRAAETKYFYQDLDATGDRLNGANSYTVTFASGELPPVRGFWSLTLYNEHHFFAPNDIARYSVGTKNKDLVPETDGSLTIFIQTGAPDDPHQRANWLPAPKDVDFSLFVRAYWPDEKVVSGDWTPPAMMRTT